MMIELRSLEVRKRDLVICRVPELSLPAGSRLAVVGANGSGKSTLLRVLAGLETGFHGRCEVGAALVERTYVHQKPYLFRGTALANVAYGLRARGISRVEAARRAHNCLERFEIPELAERTTHHLSGGELRRVALARAVVLQPRLLLLDEPLSDLDAAGSECVRNVLSELTDTTLVVASPTPLSVRLTDEELVMSRSG